MAGLATSFGSGAMTNPIADIAGTGSILAIGTNTTEDHPVIALEIKKAMANGAKLIVADPREIGLCSYAHIWLRQRPGTDVALLMGMVRVIVDEGLLDRAFIEERCEGARTLHMGQHLLLRGCELDGEEVVIHLQLEPRAQRRPQTPVPLSLPRFLL